jgi:protein PhnA
MRGTDDPAAQTVVGPPATLETSTDARRDGDTMKPPTCPACSLEDVLSHAAHWECATCGHEWPKEAAAEAARVVKDAHGNALVDGDTVILIKDLKVRGSSQVLKQGTKVKNIRLVAGDHEIDCKVDGSPMALKAMLVKKA